MQLPDVIQTSISIILAQGAVSKEMDMSTNRQSQHSTLNKPIVFTRLNQIILIALMITTCIAVISMGVSIYLIVRLNDLTLKVDALEKGKCF